MKVLCGKEEIEAPCVGAYGTSNDPIVEVDGHQCVAELYYIDEDGHILSSVCQSKGCDYCSGDYSGCRSGEFSDYQTVWIV